jgi:hypothetical protein
VAGLRLCDDSLAAVASLQIALVLFFVVPHAAYAFTVQQAWWTTWAPWMGGALVAVLGPISLSAVLSRARCDTQEGPIASWLYGVVAAGSCIVVGVTGAWFSLIATVPSAILPTLLVVGPSTAYAVDWLRYRRVAAVVGVNSMAIRLTLLAIAALGLWMGASGWLQAWSGNESWVNALWWWASALAAPYAVLRGACAMAFRVTCPSRAAQPAKGRVGL